MYWDIIKVILPSVLTFLVGIAITPHVTDYLYKKEMWKKKSGKVSFDGTSTPIFNELHKEKEVGTPRLGGIIIWSSTLVVAAAFWILSRTTSIDIFDKLEFLSRNQTWIPIVALIIGAIVGAIDDLLEIKGSKNHIAGGLSLRQRLIVVGLIGLLVSVWFSFKLGVTSIGIPIIGPIEIGWLIVPLFVLIMMFIYAGGVIDGLDGLSGGAFASIFTAYAVIAFSLNQINLAAFCGALVGGILAFLWFNVPPARFYMSETGSMALTIVLAIVALMTDSIGGGIGLAVLPVIALPLVIEVFSVIIQTLSKKLRGGKKVFLVAPIHHHFEAMGWPAYKVVMRFWIISVISAILGIIVALIF